MANQISNVSFGSPYATEEADIERRQRLAEALRAQGQTPLGPTEMVGGWAIPRSPLEGLGKVAQQLSGAYQSKRATEEQKALGQRYQSDLARTLMEAQTAGSPHSEPIDTSREGTGSMDMSGSAGPATQTVAGDRAMMARILMGHPATEPLGLQQMQQDMAMQGVFGPQGAPGQPKGSGMPTGAGAQPGGSTQAGGPDMATIQRAILSGNPALQKWGEAMLTASRGIAQRPGAPVVNPFTGAVIAQPAPQSVPGVGINMGPQGASAYPVTGASQAMAGVAGQVSGAQAAAKVPYENVTTAGGASMPAYMAPGFQPPPAPGQPPSAQQKITGEAPTDAAALEAVRLASSRGQGATIQGPDPWASIPKRPMPQGIGQSTFDKGMQEHQATKASELSTKYGELADHANQRIALNNQALSLVDKADTGPMAAQVGTVKNWLVSNLGISEDRFANTPSATTALQKDLLNAATQKAKQQFGSRMTQSEVLLMLSKGSPNVDMPKAAIKYLIGTDNATAQYQIKQANDLGQYLHKGGDPMRFDSWYSKTFPLTGATEKVHLNTGLNASAQEVADEMRKRGLIK